jgi:hypothetical protein
MEEDAGPETLFHRFLKIFIKLRQERLRVQRELVRADQNRQVAGHEDFTPGDYDRSPQVPGLAGHLGMAVNGSV